MENESVREREVKPLQKIQNNYKKIVITLYKAIDDEFDGIESIDVIEWLNTNIFYFNTLFQNTFKSIKYKKKIFCSEAMRR